MMFKILKPINDPRAEAKRERRTAKRSRDAERSFYGHKWSTELMNPDNCVRPRAEPW